MKRILTLSMLIVAACSFGQAQRHSKLRGPAKLANDVATAFSLRLGKLDRQSLLRGRLRLTMQNWIAEPEFEFKSFRNFAAMERWMKREEHQPGFPMRTSGDKVYCRRGLCRLDLLDGQMMHHHVYLTRINYGYRNGRIYIKRLRILYG